MQKQMSVLSRTNQNEGSRRAWEGGQMKFHEWSKVRIRNGTKRLTSRRENQESDPDVLYVVGPMPWQFITHYLYRAEGAESPEELQRVINQIFRRVVKPDEMFYVHVLKSGLEV